MIIEVNLFIRDRNYLFYLLLQRYVTQPPLTVARSRASWRATHAQPEPSWSAYLLYSPQFTACKLDMSSNVPRLA